MPQYRVIDADGHGWEVPLRRWDHFLPEKYRPFREKVWQTVLDANDTVRQLFDGKLFMANQTGPVPDEEIVRQRLYRTTDVKVTKVLPGTINPAIGPERASTPSLRLADMDQEGIEIAVLYPSMGLVFLSAEDLELAVVLCRAENDFMADFAKGNRQRLRPAATLPLVKPTKECVGEAIRELERAVTQLGLVAAMVPPSVRKTNLDDPVFFPLYEEAQRLGVPIGVHWSGGTHLPGVEDRLRPDQFFLGHSLGFPVENMIALGSVICSGLPDKFPRLRWAFLESGIGWVYYWMERLDEHYEKTPEMVPDMKRWPREYMTSGLIYYSCDPDERSLPFAVEMLGADLIMYASDYPHWDGRFPDTVGPIRDNPVLTPEQKRKILGENAMRFYGLE
jgi:predicted TIM-barrel fold metal-dependent hydrolase